MTSRHPDALVFALCHEVGNLLAAMRLRADAAKPETAEANTRAISALSTRSGALLAQIRPLLAGPESERLLSPDAVLARLGPDLVDAVGERVCVPASSGDLPSLSCDPELLHQILQGAALAAIHESGTQGVVRVEAGARGDRVVFRLTHDGIWPSDPMSTRPSGLALVRAVADEILGRLGGRASLEPDGLVFELPAVPDT